MGNPWVEGPEMTIWIMQCFSIRFSLCILPTYSLTYPVEASLGIFFPNCNHSMKFWCSKYYCISVYMLWHSGEPHTIVISKVLFVLPEKSIFAPIGVDITLLRMHRWYTLEDSHVAGIGFIHCALRVEEVLCLHQVIK